jgi:hypothetical protein
MCCFHIVPLTPLLGSVKTAAGPSFSAPTQRPEQQQQQQLQRTSGAGSVGSPRSLIPVSRWSKPAENAVAQQQQQQQQHDPLQQSPPSGSERPGLSFKGSKTSSGSGSVPVRIVNPKHQAALCINLIACKGTRPICSAPSDVAHGGHRRQRHSRRQQPRLAAASYRRSSAGFKIGQHLQAAATTAAASSVAA